jgi:Integrase core domain
MESRLKRSYVNPKVKTSFSGLSTFARGCKGKYKLATIKKALGKIPAYVLHKPARKNFQRRRIFIPCVGNQFVADLVDISKFASKNDNKKFLLTCMDGFSRYAHVIPIKNKTGAIVWAALQLIFDKVVPKVLQTDQGQEFLCKKVQNGLRSLNIEHFYTGSEVKASLIERFHRTLMQRVSRYMTHKDTKRFVHILPNIVSDYNATFHSSIKMPPRDVNKSNEVQVFLNLYDKPQKQKYKSKPLLNVGDRVLISKYKNQFDKGYAQSWRSEEFRVIEIRKTSPITYSLEDMNNQSIFGSFYTEELQKIPHS